MVNFFLDLKNFENRKKGGNIKMGIYDSVINVKWEPFVQALSSRKWEEAKKQAEILVNESVLSSEMFESRASLVGNFVLLKRPTLSQGLCNLHVQLAGPIIEGTLYYFRKEEFAWEYVEAKFPGKSRNFLVKKISRT
ncbi:MAG: hypothetical protein PHC85_00920 [Candidatus Pacebacteria bacterium]|nr:hypothetical protein [Candidatus Paceibacterota bacterium]